MGRSHRANQSSAPEYHLLISPQGGEKRFAAAVAKRLESLGALTQGDRSAVGARTMSVSTYNLESTYGTKAINSLYVSIFKSYGRRGTDASVVVTPDLPDHLRDEVVAELNGDEALHGIRDDCFRYTRASLPSALSSSSSSASSAVTAQNVTFDVAARVWLFRVGIADEGQATATGRTGSKTAGVAKFLNRILGLESEKQNLLYSAFLATHDKVVRQAKRDNTYETGVMTIKGPAVTIAEPTTVYTPPVSLLSEADRELLATSTISATAAAKAAVAMAVAAGSSREEQQRQRDIVRGGQQSANVAEPVVLHEVQVDRRVRFEQAKATLADAQREHAEADAAKPPDPKRKQIIKKVFGYFRSRQAGRTFVLLAVERPPDELNQRLGHNLVIFRPDTGRFEKDRRELEQQYEPIDEKTAERLWHETAGVTDSMKRFSVLTGGVLGTWAMVVMRFGRENTSGIRVMRATAPIADAAVDAAAAPAGGLASSSSSSSSSSSFPGKENSAIDPPRIAPQHKRAAAAAAAAADDDDDDDDELEDSPPTRGRRGRRIDDDEDDDDDDDEDDDDNGAAAAAAATSSSISCHCFTADQ
jgi:hypothetical protein